MKDEEFTIEPIERDWIVANDLSMHDDDCRDVCCREIAFELARAREEDRGIEVPNAEEADAP